MTSRFLSPSYGGSRGSSTGLSLGNTEPNLPLKTDMFNAIVSQKLNTSDVIGLDQALASINGITLLGLWNANDNIPTLTNLALGAHGDYYIVGVSGNTVINGFTDWVVGDWIMNINGSWRKLDNNESTEINDSLNASNKTWSSNKISTEIKTNSDAIALKLNKTGDAMVGPLTFSNLTASQILELDGSKNVISAAKGTAYNKNFGTSTDTVVDGGVYTTGINSKLNKTGDAMVGPLNLSNLTPNTILELDNTKNVVSVLRNTAHNKNFGTSTDTVVDGGVYTTAINSKLNKTGDTMNGPLTLSTLAPNTTLELDAFNAVVSATKNTAYNKNFGTSTDTVVDGGVYTTGINSKLNKTGDTMSGPLILSNLTASQILELDGSKNIISAAKGTAYNKNFGTTTTGEVADGKATADALLLKLNTSQLIDTGASLSTNIYSRSKIDELLTGYPALTGGKISSTVLPVTAMELKGNYLNSTNAGTMPTPANTGDMYYLSENNATHPILGDTAIGDFMIYNGTSWNLIPNSPFNTGSSSGQVPTLYNNLTNDYAIDVKGTQLQSVAKGTAWNANYGTTGGTVVDGGVYTAGINTKVPYTSTSSYTIAIDSTVSPNITMLSKSGGTNYAHARCGTLTIGGVGYEVKAYSGSILNIASADSSILQLNAPGAVFGNSTNDNKIISNNQNTYLSVNNTRSEFKGEVKIQNASTVDKLLYSDTSGYIKNTSFSVDEVAVIKNPNISTATQTTHEFAKTDTAILCSFAYGSLVYYGFVDKTTPFDHGIYIYDTIRNTSSVYTVQSGGASNGGINSIVCLGNFMSCINRNTSISFHNIANPYSISNINTTGGTYHNQIIVGSYLYAFRASPVIIDIFLVSNEATATIVATHSMDSAVSVATLSVVRNFNKLFCASTFAGNGNTKVMIVDISNPSSPTNNTSIDWNVNRVGQLYNFRDNQVLYVSPQQGVPSAQMYIVDVSDHTIVPPTISSTTGSNRISGVVVSDKYIYTTNDSDSSVKQWSNTAPTLSVLNTKTTTGNAGTNQITLLGKNLYVASFETGTINAKLNIFNVASFSNEDITMDASNLNLLDCNIKNSLSIGRNLAVKQTISCEALYTSNISNIDGVLNTDSVITASIKPKNNGALELKNTGGTASFVLNNTGTLTMTGNLTVNTLSKIICDTYESKDPTKLVVSPSVADPNSSLLQLTNGTSLYWGSITNNIFQSNNQTNKLEINNTEIKLTAPTKINGVFELKNTAGTASLILNSTGTLTNKIPAAQKFNITNASNVDLFVVNETQTDIASNNLITNNIKCHSGVNFSASNFANDSFLTIANNGNIIFTSYVDLLNTSNTGFIRHNCESDSQYIKHRVGTASPVEVKINGSNGTADAGDMSIYFNNNATPRFVFSNAEFKVGGVVQDTTKTVLTHLVYKSADPMSAAADAIYQTNTTTFLNVILGATAPTTNTFSWTSVENIGGNSVNGSGAITINTTGYYNVSLSIVAARVGTGAVYDLMILNNGTENTNSGRIVYKSENAFANTSLNSVMYFTAGQILTVKLLSRTQILNSGVEIAFCALNLQRINKNN